MNKRCYIAGAGEFNEKTLPGKDDYIIAANGGYAALKSRGITPDLVVGDFDSLEKEPSHPNIVRCPAEKDDTDMMLAVKQGLERGYTNFLINGGLGGRLDQTVANIQILTYIVNRNARGILTGNDVNVAAIKNSDMQISPGEKQNGTVSIFSAGDKAEGVTLKGLKYRLEDAVITNDYPIGVSNEFTDETAVISVTSGILIIMWDGLLSQEEER